MMRLGEIAGIIDGSAEKRLRMRLEDAPGIKLSIQAQPPANTVFGLCLSPSAPPTGCKYAVAETRRRCTRTINFSEGWRGHL